MKTVEGDEIRLGEPTLMPVKKIDKINVNLEEIASNGKRKIDVAIPDIHHCRIGNCSIVGKHVHVERSEFYQTQHYIKIVIDEYALYCQRILAHLKPANYKD